MNGTSVIDQFLNTFSTYIDSGFGLLRPEIAFLTVTLIVLDITLAGLYWAMEGDSVLVPRLVRKTLYIGFFAFLINDFNGIAKLIFNSFAGLGLLASGSVLDYDQFLQLGRMAQVGIDTGRPILEALGQMVGFIGFFENFVQIFVLLFAWVLVIAAFFVLAVQLFITILEFKLATLAGFVLVPFGLWGKSAFLAERVLGNVATTGIKVLVLAVVIGIGSTLFGQFSAALPTGEQPSIEDALGIVLASLVLLGLSLFCGRIAAGVAGGAPQLSAGEAAGTAAVGGGIAALGGLAALTGGRAALAGIRAAATAAGAAGGGATTAGTAGQIAAAPATAASASTRSQSTPAPAAPAPSTSSGDSPAAATVSAPSGPREGAGGSPPSWAERLRADQLRSAAETVIRPVQRSGGHGGAGANPSLDPDGKESP